MRPTLILSISAVLMLVSCTPQSSVVPDCPLFSYTDPRTKQKFRTAACVSKEGLVEFYIVEWTNKQGTLLREVRRREGSTYWYQDISVWKSVIPSSGVQINNQPQVPIQFSASSVPTS